MTGVMFSAIYIYIFKIISYSHSDVITWLLLEFSLNITSGSSERRLVSLDFFPFP